MSVFARSRLRTGYARRYARKHSMSGCDLVQLTGLTRKELRSLHEGVNE